MISHKFSDTLFVPSVSIFEYRKLLETERMLFHQLNMCWTIEKKTYFQEKCNCPLGDRFAL